MIRHAEINDAHIIQSIAYETWPATYGNIISAEQIEFMLDKYYHLDKITACILDDSHIIYVYELNSEVIGYIHAYSMEDHYHISKLYILPTGQGKGIGNQLLDKLYITLKLKNIQIVTLNVNRHNPAYHFYLKMGFQVIEEVDIPLDRFWLNDYVMQKKIT
jgi:ribosomal protein S18 acetylase RimI-like enzyme